jgi:hypothetical protein
LAPFTPGPFTITPYLIDHSAFDSSCFLDDAGGRQGRASGGRVVQARVDPSPGRCRAARWGRNRAAPPSAERDTTEEQAAGARIHGHGRARHAVAAELGLDARGHSRPAPPIRLPRRSCHLRPYLPAGARDRPSFAFSHPTSPARPDGTLLVRVRVMTSWAAAAAAELTARSGLRRASPSAPKARVAREARPM